MTVGKAVIARQSDSPFGLTAEALEFLVRKTKLPLPLKDNRLGLPNLTRGRVTKLYVEEDCLSRGKVLMAEWEETSEEN